MKKLFRILITALLVAILAGAGVNPMPPAQAASKTTEVSGRYYQSDARKMKKKINKFRKGKEAWYYTREGSKDKTYVKGLGKLKYDYELEKVAMERAAEIAVSFSHTRPNNESCFSAYPAGYMAMGENIAMGTSSYMSCAETFALWQETNESYNGQGHRRNMLGEQFTCVGIACFEANGNKYWVQEFGSPCSSTGKTKAANGEATVKIQIK